MNETIELIRTRRSVRDFSSREVPIEMIEAIVDAGLSAPSAWGKRSWHVAVFRDQATRNELTEKIPWVKPVRDGQFAIMVLGDPEAGVQKEYWPQDCAALAENMLIAARSLGLGTTWCGIYPMADNGQKVREVFDIPEGLVPFCVIGVGWPEKENAFRERDTKGDEGRVSWFPQWARIRETE